MMLVIHTLGKKIKRKNSEKYLHFCVLTHVFSLKMLFELKTLSKLQQIYGCGSPEKVLRAVTKPLLNQA